MTVYHNKLSANDSKLIYLNNSQPANVNLIVNIPFSDNVFNLDVIDSLHDDPKFEIPISISCPKVQSSRNKDIPVARKSGRNDDGTVRD